MTKYKVTERVVGLVQDLIQQGYGGEASLTNSGCTGTMEHLEGSFAIHLPGFCKESLYLTESESGNIVFIGRYSVERDEADASVEDIVRCAWKMYQYYKARGYSMPGEFKSLFEHYGHIRKRTRTVTDWVEDGETT